MVVDKINFNWENTFSGTMMAPTGEIKIGSEANTFKPYHLLFGALGSCFYHTFITIVQKKRLTFSGATLEISGNKRDTVPTTLENVQMTLVIKDASDQEKFKKSVDLAAQNCSIHETISKVAKIKIDVKFK
jgi:putative redox protein